MFYKCDFCEFVSFTSKKFDSHMQTTHPNVVVNYSQETVSDDSDIKGETFAETLTLIEKKRLVRGASELLRRLRVVSYTSTWDEVVEGSQPRYIQPGEVRKILLFSFSLSVLID